MRVDFRNNGSEVHFRDEWCDGIGMPMTHYSKDVNSSLFGVTDIALKSETSVVRRIVETKKLFRTVKNEIEEQVTEHFIELSYKPFSYKDEIKVKRTFYTCFFS